MTRTTILVLFLSNGLSPWSLRRSLATLHAKITMSPFCTDKCGWHKCRKQGQTQPLGRILLFETLVGIDPEANDAVTVPTIQEVEGSTESILAAIARVDRYGTRNG